MNSQKAVESKEKVVVNEEERANVILSATDLIQEMRSFCAEMNVSLQDQSK